MRGGAFPTLASRVFECFRFCPEFYPRPAPSGAKYLPRFPNPLLSSFPQIGLAVAASWASSPTGRPSPRLPLPASRPRPPLPAASLPIPDPSLPAAPLPASLHPPLLADQFEETAAKTGAQGRPLDAIGAGARPRPCFHCGIPQILSPPEI
jgi:hypothetical protein